MPQNAWLVIGTIALVGLVWWIFRPSTSGAERAHTGPAPGSDGSTFRLVELGMAAVTHGVKVSLDDPSLVDRWDFPPFGRGDARRATEVLRGAIDGEDVLAFCSSFALPGESRRREFDVTVVPANYGWRGRLRVAANPREPGAEPTFDEAFRVDERPEAQADPLTSAAQSILLTRDFASSALVVSPREIMLIDGQRREFDEVADVVTRLKRLRAAIAAE